MDWCEILKEIGIVGIISGLIVWLIKGLGQHFISKRFAAYNHELEIKKSNYQLELDKKSQEFIHQLDLSLESHRGELQILYVKASKLHENRLIIIAHLYEKIVTLNDKMREMTAKLKQVTGNIDEDEEAEWKRIGDAGMAYDEFRFNYLKNRIYFTIETCKLLDRLNSEYYDSHWEYTFGKRWNISDPELTREKFLKSSEKVHQEIPKILEQVEMEFRNIIGV